MKSENPITINLLAKIIKNNKTKMSKKKIKKGLYIQLMPILNLNMKTIK